MGVAMTEKKNPESSNFANRLDQAATDKDKLLQLARDVIDESHDGRSFSQRRSRDLRVNPTGIFVGDAIARVHEKANANLSTNDKLYMVMQQYINLSIAGNPRASKDKALAKFCQEFAQKYPKEFGAENVSGRVISPQMKQNMAIGQQGHSIV